MMVTPIQKRSCGAEEMKPLASYGAACRSQSASELEKIAIQSVGPLVVLSERDDSDTLVFSEE